MNLVSGNQITLKGALMATFMGAVSGAVTFGIGEALQGFKFALKATYSALAHGTFQGLVSGIQGGGFWAGFAAGSIASMASSVFKWDGNGAKKGLGWGSSVRDSTGGMIAFGTIMGGAGAALTGGNFWQGAVTGLVVAGLNHAMHQIDPPGKKRDPLVRADGSRITNADVDGDGKVALIELEYWYRNGGGKAININASSLSMDGVDPNLFKGLAVGSHVGVNLLFSDFWGGEGALYGELDFEYRGGNQVKITPNIYNFDVGADVGHPWFNSASGFVRNVGTVLGNIAAGSGTEYMINFKGNATLKFNPNK